MVLSMISCEKEDLIIYSEYEQSTQIEAIDTIDTTDTYNIQITQ